jgi:hypothetical protein
MTGELALAGILLLAVIPGAWAQVYKCTGADGKVIYQQQACGADKRKAALPIEAPGPTGSERYRGDLGLDYHVAMVLLMKLSCDDAVPGYRERTATDYAIWRKKHYASLVKVENDPDVRNMVDNMRKLNRANPSSEAATQMRSECDGYAGQMAAEAQGPDPRFASPEKTWEAWQSSLRRGDREGAKRCLIDTVRKKAEPILNRATPDELKAMADAIGTFKLTEGSGEVRQAVATRKDGRSGFVYFLNVAEEWKINEM